MFVMLVVDIGWIRYNFFSLLCDDDMRAGNIGGPVFIVTTYSCNRNHDHQDSCAPKYKALVHRHQYNCVLLPVLLRYESFENEQTFFILPLTWLDAFMASQASPEQLGSMLGRANKLILAWHSLLLLHNGTNWKPPIGVRNVRLNLWVCIISTTAFKCAGST